MSHLHITLGRRQFVLGTTALAAGAVLPDGAGGSAARHVIHRARSAVTQSLGGLEVVALRDAHGAFPLTRDVVFPQATEHDWQRAEAIDPGAFGPGLEWRLDFTCFAIRRRGGRITLVDAGIGPDGSPATWAPLPGRLPDVLTENGIEVDDVDTVVLTHVHEDHVGWTVTAAGTPMFPHARYIVQRAEITALPDGAVREYAIRPLQEAGRLHEIDGAVRLYGKSAGNPAGRITVVPTPGHTVGHQSVLVEGGEREVVITGDVLVHAVQLANPDVGYEFEQSQETARRTRRSLITDALERHALLATNHLTQPFVQPR